MKIYNRKYLALILLFMVSFSLKAEWIFVDESSGLGGVGAGDRVYIWKTYTTNKDGFKELKLLHDYDYPMGNEKSGSLKVLVHCDRPHRMMLGDSEGFSEKMGRGYSLGVEKGAWWMTFEKGTVYRKVSDMVCK